VEPPEVITVDAGPVGLGARSWQGGAGRPVLLVHGLSSNARLWDGVGAHLAAAGLAHAEVVEFRGGDHDLHAQYPQRVAELIEGLA
jgi:pimeloyl-ACP methyl ester carboxylesterase